MAKYTDEQIKKALELHADEMICAVTDTENNTYFVTNADVLNLINRQEAEKEALIAGQETLQKYLAEKEADIAKLKTDVDFWKRKTFYGCMRNGDMHKVIDKLKSEINSAKSEAIKEYKSRVENDIITLLGKSNCVEFLEVLDYACKETVGEGE